MAFDMNIACTNCGKNTAVALKYDAGSMAAKVAEEMTGVKPFCWIGKADCPCGHETMASMTVTCTKNAGNKCGCGGKCERCDPALRHNG